MKIADLFAVLRLKPDAASFKAADRALESMRSQVVQLTTALAAAFGVGEATRDLLNFDEALTSLEISSAGALGSIADFRDQLLGVSDDTGVAKEDLLAASSAFIALTGNGKAATESMETFAKVNKATSSSMEDIAATAAAINQNLGVMPEQFEQAFSTLVAQGKAGAIELKDLASLMAPLTPLAAQFEGGKGLEGMSRLGAALQIARRGFGSAAQTGTGLEALMGALTSKAGAFKGVKIFEKGEDGVKRLRAIDEIIKDISSSKLAKDPEALTKAFGSKEAYAAYLQLSQNREEWDKLTKSTLKANDVQEDYLKRQASLSAKAAKAWNYLKNVVTKATIVLVDNFKLVLMVIGSIIIAIGILKFESIAAAMASAAAWVMAMLPLIALAAAILAVILIIEDLYQWFTGGDSYIAKLYDSFVHWLGEIWDHVVEWAEKLKHKMKETIDDVVGIVTFGLAGNDPTAMDSLGAQMTPEGIARNDRIRRAKASGFFKQGEFAYDPGEEALQDFAAKQLEDSLGSMSALANQSTDMKREARIAQLQKEIEMEKQGKLAPRGAVQNNSFVINEAGDAEKTRAVVREELDRTARDLNGVAPGEEYH